MYDWRKLTKISFITGIIVFVLGTFFFSSNGFQKPAEELFISFAIYQLYAFVLGFVNSYYFHVISIRIPWEKNFVKAIVYGFSGSLILTTLALILLRFIAMVLFFGHDPETFLQHSKMYFIFGISITAIISLIFYIFYFYKAVTEKKITESEVVAKTETAKYESLKSQLDPHFLFNSLNVLTSLIGEDPKLAEKFTTKLSKVYRYVLEQKNKDLITFDEELSFARTYMELLKMRFEDAVLFDLPESSSNPDFKIVPLSLQILLENAVKHNVISSDNPLKIRIYESGGILVVENKINKKNTLDKSTKVGLQNIKDRYDLITKRPVLISSENDVFKVSLPLLTQKIKDMNTDRIDESRYVQARKRVDALKEFYGSLISYVLIIPFLYYIWYRFTPGAIQWFWFPAFGWGLGLFFQGLKVYGNPFLGKDWEERKIREYMNKDEKQYWK
ncbi:MAG: histidine kinase [Flavobacteriia bacterium]|nr:MAG: histidine kinase [Flavobacteriia bacterium]